jgi:predicted RNA-binding Zn ribbon-like protein
MYLIDMETQHDWQEPGGRLPAPGMALHRLQDFVNTNDVEGDGDALATPEKLRDWLTAAGVLPRGPTVSNEAHERAIAVREGLRALGEANNGEPLDAARLAAMNRAAARVPLVASVDEGESWTLDGAEEGVDGYLGRILATLLSSMADGSWSRVKACRNDTCRWLFYDASRNRSGTWCTMAICGSRMKARAYRARRRSTTETADAHA